ncbi:TPA: hypothetical protein I7730_01135 [Vibrio vulnificus]|uniref:Uncharacterized protein n=1 Tax=Vibrio vulnificus TaxID=672 RepID=A0A8H9K5V9_VIBVL|nr:hypothetical protein [Vibrio vulnificus]HAS8538403.1 hypothetical protein [Vibrio vulnificus]
MKTKSGFVHAVLSDKFENEFMLLGDPIVQENQEDPNVLLETDSGSVVEVSRGLLQGNYKYAPKVRLSENLPLDWMAISIFSPVFRSQQGDLRLLIAVTSQDKKGIRYAIYQRLDGEQIFSTPLDSFYDTHALIKEVGVSSSPVELDGKWSYVTNEGSADKGEFPIRVFNVDRATGEINPR